jgi:hypothetical protein
MPASPIRFELRGDWKRYEHLLSHPKFRSKLKKTLPPRMEKSSLQMQKLIRAKIREGKFAKNAPLTIAIKKSSKPLADYGDLFAAVTYQMTPDGTESFVGILQTARTRDGRSLANIAEGLHEGMRIAVTPRMRRMFAYLAAASEGYIPASELTGRAAVLFERFKKWKPLKETTTHIVIPGRPFIETAFSDSSFRGKFRIELENAVREALKMIR